MSIANHQRTDLTEFDIFSTLEENNGAGLPLRYTEIYDQIKEARREDDANLSRGIWKTAIKRADWIEVESLCVKALSNKSKDLQIFGWLMESWLVMDNLKGAIHGFEMLGIFCEQFWFSLYPKLETEEDDARLFVFDWIDKTLHDRLLFIEVTPILENINLRALTLADWIDAVNFEKIIKRSGDSKSMIAEAEAKGKITLNRFRQGLTTAPKEYIEQMSDGATQLLKSIENFCLKIETLSQYQIPFFLTIRELITTIIRVTQATLGRSQSDQLQPIEIVKNNNSEQAAFDTKLSLDGNAPSDTNTEESTEVEIIQQRSDAYRALHELGKFLMEIDPHSPTPYLLELIVSWEDKKLLQIVSDVTDGKTEAHNMLKLLAGVATNR